MRKRKKLNPRPSRYVPAVDPGTTERLVTADSFPRLEARFRRNFVSAHHRILSPLANVAAAGKTTGKAKGDVSQTAHLLFMG